MCITCWDDDRKPSMDTPEIRKAARLVTEVFDESAVGGKLHIVIDDWNLEQSHLDFCGRELATDTERRCHAALDALTELERASALGLQRGYWKTELLAGGL